MRALRDYGVAMAVSRDPVTLAGAGRIVGAGAGTGVGAAASPCRVTLEDDRFEVAVAGVPPVIASYRDITTLAVQPGAALLVLGDGSDAAHIVLERFGEHLDTLVRELRDRRTRLRLRDALVELPVSEPLEIVEYRLGSEHGVGQLVIGPWGAELVPVDERLAWRRLRRAEIATVTADRSSGSVLVERSTPLEAGSADPPVPFEIIGLGEAADRWADRLTGLRDAAFQDAAALVAGLVPDAPFGTRQRLNRTLVDGRPAATADLGDAVSILDAAVLTEPTFAVSFRELLARAGDPPLRWFAMAPEHPGTDVRKAWYLVGLPGNLLALELVSAGAHATYLFRVVPRAAYEGTGPATMAEAVAAAVREVSAALVDARFLREPMALPEEQLALAANLRYRLALAALPTLAAARRRFVARLVHDDPVRWAAALDDLIRWHAAVRDDAAEWPGRAAEEAAVAAAAGEDGDQADGDDDGDGGSTPAARSD